MGLLLCFQSASVRPTAASCCAPGGSQLQRVGLVPVPCFVLLLSKYRKLALYETYLTTWNNEHVVYVGEVIV